MATSGTTVFEKTLYIDEVIEEVLRANRYGQCKRLSSEISSGVHWTLCFQEWANRGLHYWEIGKHFN